MPGTLARWLRRLRRPLLLFAVAWLFGVATPLHCIIHCAVHPFLLAAATSDPRQHVCHLDIGGDAGHQLASGRVTLPHVVQVLAGAPSLGEENTTQIICKNGKIICRRIAINGVFTRSIFFLMIIINASSSNSSFNLLYF